MINVVFKDVEKSDLARERAVEVLEDAAATFPDLQSHNMTVTLSMENSPAHRGPDGFTVKLWIRGKKYKNMILTKSADNLYMALAIVKDHLIERLNRMGDRRRVKNRHARRSFQRFVRDAYSGLADTATAAAEVVGGFGRASELVPIPTRGGRRHRR